MGGAILVLICCAIFIGVIFFLTTLNTAGSNALANIKPPVNGTVVDETDFEITLPDSWKKHSVPTLEGHIFYFPKDEVDNSDGFAENVNVIVEDADGETFAKGREQVLDELRAGAGTGLSNPEVGESKDIKLDGHNALMVEYSADSDGENLSFTLFFTIVRDKMYLFTYTGHVATEYDDYLDDVMSMMASVKF